MSYIHFWNEAGEQWKPVKGSEGLYEVSSEGRVRSWYDNYGRRRNEPLYLKPVKNTNGYMQIALFRDGKRKWYLIHRLVAEAFIDNPNNLPQVNHKDECKTNNWVSNLEYCDNKYNANYGTRNERIAKTMTNRPIQSKPVLQYTLDGQLVQEWPSMHEAERNGFSQGNIWKCCRGKYKSHGGFIWKYKEQP